MAEVTMTTAAAPDGAPRLAGLDILRGIAILGILFMNINEMGASMTASWVDIRSIGWSAVDQWIWWLREVFWVGTARCMLEMLFGVGMVILTERAADAATDLQVLKRYYARNLILFGFGLFHIFILLWPGDILHTYGIAALIAFLFRRLTPRDLLMFGLIGAMAQLVIGGFAYVHAEQGIAAIERQAAGKPTSGVDASLIADRRETIANDAERDRRDQADIRTESRQRTGNFVSWARAAWAMTIDLESQGLELLWIWEAAGTMLIGAALFRWGIIQGDRSRKIYAMIAVAGLGFGIACRAIGASAMITGLHAPNPGWATGEVSRLSMTIGYIAIVHLILKTRTGSILLHPFVAAGRTALSIYIAQTLMGVWLLYPPFALALYGTQGWAAMMLTALGVNAALLILANLYLQTFSIGPVEWVWRSLLAQRRLPIRRQRAAPAATGGAAG